MMSTPMMFVLSALLVAMVTCSGDEDPDPAYNDKDMEGTWYIMGSATNKWEFTRTQVTKVVVADGELSATFSEGTLSTDGTCFTSTPDMRSYTKEKTGVFEYDISNKEYEVVVKQFNATHGYAVIHTAVHDDGQDAHEDHDCINELYSRTLTVTQAVKDEFERMSLADDDIPNTNVNFQANTTECSE